jgi:hypothetical protein
LKHAPPGAQAALATYRAQYNAEILKRARRLADKGDPVAQTVLG